MRTTASGIIECSTCHGSGEVRQVSRSMFGQFINVQVCPTCNGEGKIIKDKCPVCSGEGRVRGETTLKVNVPGGVSSGNYIPLRGNGNAGIRGGAAGDLIVIIEEVEHKFFVRDEDDILFELNMSVSDAVLGTELEVPVLGSSVMLKVEPGTQQGKILRLKDKGIKHLNHSGRGDQLIKVNVIIPTKISSKEKELFKELSHIENSKKSGAKESGSQSKGFFNKMKSAF